MNNALVNTACTIVKNRGNANPFVRRGLFDQQEAPHQSLARVGLHDFPQRCRVAEGTIVALNRGVNLSYPPSLGVL
jgi:hypothetical protein